MKGVSKIMIQIVHHFVYGFSAGIGAVACMTFLKLFSPGTKSERDLTRTVELLDERNRANTEMNGHLGRINETLFEIHQAIKIK